MVELYDSLLSSRVLSVGSCVNSCVYYTLKLRLFCVCWIVGVGSASFLQAVAEDVPLVGVPDGVGALEEVQAVLLAGRSRVGIKVLVQQFPHIVGQRKDLEVLGVPGREASAKFG